MQLPYRPKFLPRERESGPARVRRRLAAVSRTPFAPEPHVAPAALFGDAARVYTPGPALVDRGGVYLFRDGPAPGWPKGRDPAPPHAVPPPAWSLILQGALLTAAVLAGGVIEWGVGR